jgi:dipeptidyl aminopeptidase/acylaminoacyl peptidase
LGHAAVLAVTLGIAAVAATSAQEQRPAVTAADYARAEKFLAATTTPLVLGSGVRPTWLPDGRFWYRVTTATGSQAFLIDPAKGTRSACDLPACAETAGGGRGGRGGGGGRGNAAAAPPQSMSPDGTRAVFIRDWNLWARDVASGKETPLTTDGVKDFGYATDNAGWAKSDRPIVAWSPDSKKVATFQQDQRTVGEMYLVSTAAGHPELQAWKYPLPGDAGVAMIQRVVIDVDAVKIVRFKMEPDQHRSTLCDNLACRGSEWGDVQWNPNSSDVAFASSSRDHKKVWLRVADASTGAVREVLDETTPTFYESGNGRINWRYLPASNEVIWFSERDNWGQLYLCDLATGKLKNPITTGEGNVTQLVRIDDKARTLYFQAVGKQKGIDPYFTQFYRIGMDGKNLQILTPEASNHEITLSDNGAYFVDSFSTPDTPPVAVLRDQNGKTVMTLEKADISKLTATGWKPPIPITVKARDGQTDLYGLMYQPTNLDPTKKYPIINHIYPGPQTGSVGGRSFSPARGDNQALAELGFIVVEIDGMGTPWRSKKFHEAYFGDMADNTLPDQVAGMKQLAAKYPYIDLDRAGIWGHSGGGYATGAAMFHYPDVFKVGISESGNHDNRVYEDDWAEKWTGLLEKKADGTSSYDSQANQNFAKNLKGKLLLAHGTMDNNVPPNNTLLVVEALIKANKDFDLLMLPNQAHGYATMGNYMMRRRWDYFVKNLLGAEPPKEYEIGKSGS